MNNFAIHNKDLFDKLDKFINSIVNDKNALISTLHFSQNLFGYLPKEVQIYIGQKLNIPLNKIENTIDFYHYFTTELKGEFQINVCSGSACCKNRSNEIMDKFKELLDINAGETTKDKKFTLESSRCMGMCRKPPIISVNGKIYESVTLDDVHFIIENCK